MYLKVCNKTIIPFFLYMLTIGIFIYSYKPNIKKHTIDYSPLIISQTPQKVDYTGIRSWPLFGVNTESTISKISYGNIKLVGIIYKAQSTDKSKAVILMDNKEYILCNGDNIGNSYIIYKIEPSRIIIGSHNGLEELALWTEK